MTVDEAKAPDIPSALVIDRRGQTSGPGLHVLVVGVSDYRHLPEVEGTEIHNGRRTYGLAKLHSAATTASRFVEFLHDLPDGVALTRPLRTCRLLLSPHEVESADVAQTLGRVGMPAVPPATADELMVACSGWRQDAEADGHEALTLFYFAGHGVQVAKGRNVTMLLADFPPAQGGAPMQRALHLSNLESFMSGSSAAQANAPRNQYYFIDACRSEPDELVAHSKKAAWAREQQLLEELADAGGVNMRHQAAHFFAAKAGGRAWGRSGMGTYFGHALRKAMVWAASHHNEPIVGFGGPLITPESLGKALRHEYAAVIEQELADNHIQVRDVIGANAQPELPEIPHVDPTAFLPLLRLDSLPDCRIQFGLVPPGRGESSAYVEFRTSAAPDIDGHLVYSGPLEHCPRFWSSPGQFFAVRVWKDRDDHAQGRQPVKESSGYLVRPADRVTLVLEAS